LLILLVAAGVRFWSLDRQSLWDDESFTLYRIGILPAASATDLSPELFFALLRGWTRIAGESVAAIRGFSALWGVAGVILVGAAGWRMISPYAGLAAAGLLALHPFHLAYSQEARPYTMLFALVVAAVWAIWEKSAWATMAVSAAALWTHPWGAFIWILGVVTLRRWQPILAPVLAAPAIWHMTHLGSAYKTFWACRSNFEALWGVVKSLSGSSFYVGGWRYSPGLSLLPTLLFVVLWCAGFMKEDQFHTRRLLLYGSAALIFLPLIAGLTIPEVAAHNRYFIAALPVAIILAARGWAGVPVRWRLISGLIMVALLCWSTHYYFTGWQKGNYKQAYETAKALGTPDTILVVESFMRPLWDYYDRSGLPKVNDSDLDIEELQSSQYDRLLLLTMDAPDETRDELDARFPILERRRYPADYQLGLCLTLYSIPR
jgi:hypothetical protein